MVVYKTFFELAELSDLVRLVVFLSNNGYFEKPLIYRFFRNDELFFIAIKLHIYGYTPLVTIFYNKLRKRISRKYFEYNNEGIERIKTVDIREVSDPTHVHVAIYNLKKRPRIIEGFLKEERDKMCLEKLSSKWIEKIKIPDLGELTRLAFISRSIIFVQKLSENNYLYFTGFPIPIWSLTVGESLYNPILYCFSGPPIVNGKFASFISYVSKDNQIKFKLGLDMLDSGSPLIYVKNHPLGEFD